MMLFKLLLMDNLEGAQTSNGSRRQIELRIEELWQRKFKIPEDLAAQFVWFLVGVVHCVLCCFGGLLLVLQPFRESR